MGKRSPRWAFWKWLTIRDRTDPGRVYLRRLRIVDTPLFGVYLHWIYLPDREREPHDHPWKFLSVILRGGYTEKVYWTFNQFLRGQRSCERHGRFSVHTMPLESAHRIDALEDRTVTLVVRGRRCKSWGFWTRNGVVDWKDYDRSSGPDPFGS